MASLTSFTMPLVSRVRAPALSSSSSARLSVHRRSAAVSVVAAIGAGSKIKVSKDIMVYHIPKTKGAEINLNGFEGEVMEVIEKTAAGVPLSANLPIKVRLSGEVLDKGVLSFIAHLEDHEVTEL
mmetsp:Transcript_4672/g.7946  ORF Transcript_4672/g.7946 Transcript_4672/m.7946 type:complete len:125 (-) Transcript_4672:486-860(-)